MIVKSFNDVPSEDTFFLFKELQDSGAFGAIQHKSISPFVCHDVLEALRQANRLRGCGVYTRTGKLVGVYICALSNRWYDPSELILNEMVVQVHPAFKSMGVFSLMQGYIDQLCVEQNISVLSTGNEVMPNDAAYTRLMKRKGFEPRTVYIKNFKEST